MPFSWLVLIILAIAAAGYVLGRKRALNSASGDRRNLHSLPSYYGAHAAMWAVVPATAVLLVWMLAQPFFVNARVLASLPDTVVAEGSSIGLVMSDIRRVADGLDEAVRQGAMTRTQAAALDTDTTDVRDVLGGVGVALGSGVSADVLSGAQLYRVLNSTATNLMSSLVVLIALGGAAYG
jgi:phosphate transport system permease protein